ncbi:hypothetical protein AGMMS4956_14360 [Bacteroidia bacterium]|nr:hypothetical protein AGMMS4956_14360 [Bacteroidia bacterium]
MYGSTNNVANPSTYTIESGTITLQAPTKTGYTFTGWFTGIYADTKVTTIPAGSTGGKTLYAIWAAVSYTIHYELDGGSNNVNNPATYTIEDAVALQDPTKVGYRFLGWYDNAGFAGSAITSIAVGSTGDTTFYANWIDSSVVSTLTFDSQGGSEVAAKYIEKDATATPPADPTKSGYIFDGWYKEAACTNAWNFATDVVTANVTLYAKWIEDNSTAPTDPTDPTSVATQGIASLQIYPNPTTNGELRIESGELNAGDRVEIYNVNGTLVGAYRIRPTINIAHLPAGIYIVKVGNRAAKVVKQFRQE